MKKREYIIPASDEVVLLGGSIMENVSPTINEDPAEGTPENPIILG